MSYLTARGKVYSFTICRSLLIYRRSVQSAMTVALGGIAGIMATTVFRAQDSPRYLPGKITVFLTDLDFKLV